MRENCLLCLSTLSGRGKDRAISSLFKLVQRDDGGYGDDDERLVLCPDCEGIVDSATEIHNEISKLQIKLKTKIENVRETILKSLESKEKYQASDKRQKHRQTFINLTSGTWVKNENELIVDETVVKMEESEEDEIDLEVGGPFSPSALMLNPVIGDDYSSSNSKQEKSDEEPESKPFKSTLPKSINYATDSGDNYESETDYPEVEELTNSSDDEELKSKKPKNKPKLPIQRKYRGKGKKEKTKTLKVFPCGACGKTFSKNIMMVLHMFSKHETDDKQFSCFKPNCNKRFTLEVNLQRHLEAHKKEKERPMVCEFCDSRFATQVQLDAHHKYHNGYPCKFCGKLLKFSSSLVRHLCTHTGAKPYVCSICKEAFIDHNTRQIHIERVHEKQQHPCNLCQAIFNTKFGLQFHLKRHERREGDVKCEEPGCGATFINNYNLSVHQIKLHGMDPFICDECGTQFVSKYGLRKHKTKHTGIKNYKCDKCDSAFFTASEMKTHSVIHSKERPFVCSFCGNAFKTKQKLRVHEKAMHSKDYVPNHKFQCKECEKKFPNKILLDGHIRQVHTGERPFVCHFPSCEQKYALKYALTQHLRKSHGISPTLKFDKAPRSKRDVPLKSATTSREKRRKQESEESRSSNEDLNNEMQNATIKISP